MWSFVKCMAGRGVNHSPDGTSITVDGVSIDDPLRKSDIFAEHFSKVFPPNIPPNPQFQQAIMSSIQSASHTILNDPITPAEIDRCLPKSKIKAVGTDRISNIMLNSLSPENKIHLHHLFNTHLNNSFVPPQWKQSIIIPLLKPDKPADDPSSYRPISLTSCLCKVMERILSNRIQWLLECKCLINREQAGFRRGCSTTDHITQLESHIKQDFSKKRSTVAVFLDISKAYDSVWTQGLLYKSSRLGISGPILAWLQEFLTGRSICVRVGSQSSRFIRIENGVPQGAVLSPTLFNIMLMDLPKLSPLTKIYLFADDVTITASCKQPSDAEVTIQPALDKVHRWSSKWKLKLAPDKSACVVFSRSYKPGPDPLLFINGHPIPPKSKFKFLGIWFDQKLLWKPHIEHVHAHCIKLKNLFSMITNSKCGPSTKTLILLFKTLVRSKTDYGLIAYGNASKSNLTKIDIPPADPSSGSSWDPSSRLPRKSYMRSRQRNP